MSDDEVTKQNVRKLPSTMASMSLKRGRDASESPDRNVRPRDEEHQPSRDAFATEYFANAALKSDGMPTDFGSAESFEAGPHSTKDRMASDGADLGDEHMEVDQKTTKAPKAGSDQAPTSTKASPILDILCGKLPYPAHQHRNEIIHRVLEGIRMRDKTNSLILQGRTAKLSRRTYHPDAYGHSSIKSRLEEAFLGLPNKGKKQKVEEHEQHMHRRVIADIEDSLWNLVAWNTTAFAELTSEKAGLARYPPLFANSSNYGSALVALRSNGLKLLPFTHENVVFNATNIFNFLRKHILQRVPDSGLLVTQVWSTAKGSTHPRINPSDARLMNLAVDGAHFNFYGLMVHQMSEAARKWAGLGAIVACEKVEAAAETQVYRLLLKEPAAFADVLLAMEGL